MTPRRRTEIDRRIEASKKARKSKNAARAEWRNVAYDLHADLEAAEKLIAAMDAEPETPE